MRKFIVSLESDLRHVAIADTYVRSLCNLSPLSPSEGACVLLSVVEWLNNVIRHGYNDQPGQMLRLEVELQADYLRIRIHDWGCGLPDGALEKASTPLSEAALLRYDLLPEGGWGLYLIKRCMDRVNYHSNDGHNVLTLVKRYPV